MYNNKSNSIFKRLTQDDIVELYYDYQLHNSEEGFDFYYVIDADELYDYCFPRRNTNKNDSEIADEQFIIEYLFLSKDHKIIIIDDYLKEIFDLRSKLLSVSSLKYREDEISYHLNQIEELIDINDIKYDSEEYFNKVNESLSYLMYISEGMYETNLSKLNDLLSNPIIYESRCKDIEIKKAFNSYKKNTENFNELLSFFHTKEISKHNDVNGILKTYFLSSYFENHNKIFYFLSSSTTGVTKIKEDIISIGKLIGSNNKPYGISLIRNKLQLFASLIFNTFEFEANDIKHFTKILEKVANKLDSDNNDSELIDLLKKNRNSTVEQIENYTIIKNRNKRREEEEVQIALRVENFERLFRIKKTSRDLKIFKDNIQRFINRINSIVENEINLIDLNKEYQETKILMKHLLFEMDVIDNFLANALYKKEQIELDRGADPIESTFSAFPILFEYDFYSEKIFPALLNIEDNTITEGSIFTTLPRSCLNEDNSKTYVLVIYISYLLLLVKYEHPTRKYSNNFLVFNYIKELLSHISFSKKHKADIYAIGCWSARRCRKYKFAYDLSIDANKLFPDDPRFDFSLALIGYSWRYEYDTIERYEWDYKDYYNNDLIFNSCEEGIKKYKNNFDISISDTIKYSYIALLNLTAFSYAAAYKNVLDLIDKNHEKSIIKIALQGSPQKYLKKSRVYINELKQLLDVEDSNNKGIKMSRLPEYIHTEVFLEYYELRNSIYFSREIRYRKKMIAALIDINSAIKSCGPQRIGLRKRCERLLDKLKSLY